MNYHPVKDHINFKKLEIMKNENLTVKQIYKSKNVELMSEASTLMFNVQTMGKIARRIYPDGTVENMTIEELRTAQDELIPLYNEALKRYV